jgi:ribonuclease P protein subunit RPR2
MSRAYIKEIARERIEILLRLARKVMVEDPDLARRYVKLAWRIGMKCNVRMRREEKLYLCRKCYTLLIPGVNCRVRVRAEAGTKTVITCLECGSKRRYPALKEKSPSHHSWENG